MSIRSFDNLPWLLPRPEDYDARLKTASAANDIVALSRLSHYQGDFTQTDKLGRRLLKAMAGKETAGALLVFSNATTTFLLPGLAVAGARHGIPVQPLEAAFDQVWQAAIDPRSIWGEKPPSKILILLDHRALSAPGRRVDDALAAIDRIAAVVARHSGIQLVVSTVPAPVERLFGAIEGRIDDAPYARCARFNRCLDERARDGQLLLADLGGLSELIGLANWHNPRYWHAAKLAFDPAWAPLAADFLIRPLAAAAGKSKRVLVLDLDNTLWGGVIGDDGLGGITLGQGNATGEAFLAIQSFALALRDRGVVLAVSSKNNDDVARQVFRDHPDMLLREEHIAVFQANWSDKASNLRAIAETLDLTTHHLAVLDDNPVERAQIRAELPEVAVPELTDDPADYPLLLALAGCFEAVSFGEEDRKRAGAYQDNARRAELKATASNIEEFLWSLEMVIDARPFDDIGRPRIVQLIAKSNQFNLTAIRHTDADVRAFQVDDRVITLQVRLADRFGDNGMIAVVIARPLPDSSYEVDTWVMSCRVLGRRVEEFVLGMLAGLVRRKGGARLVGRFRPTGRNDLVREHYSKLGFRDVAQDGKDRLFDLDLRDYSPAADLPFRMAHS